MSTTAAPPQPTVPPRSVVPAVLAVLIGVLAVWAAVGVGHLVGAIISPSSSPYIAVADTVVRLSPSWLTEFGKSLGPVLDKLFLKIGVLLLVTVVGAIAGFVARRRPTPGVAVVVVLGLVGLVAVVFAPVFSPLDLVAPAVALGTGVGVLRGLRLLVLGVYHPPARLRGRAAQVSRRNVLIGTSAAVGVGAVGAFTLGELFGGGVGGSRQSVTDGLARSGLAARAPAIPQGAAFAELGTPTFLTANPDFYRIDVALRVPSQQASDWKMRIHGMVDKEITLKFDDLLAMPLVERTITLTCVSNEVGGNLISTANFIGVELRDLLTEAGVRPGAQQLFTTSIDGWTAGTPVDVVMEPDRGALLAIGMNGEALPAEHGFPVRMVVPGLYGFVSATKWIADMEVTTFGPQRQAYWLQRGWAQEAPIKTQSRVDSPRGFASVPAGKVSVAGIAWSQHTGIDKVEVRMDGGPWQEAELATEVNYDTWRMWRTDFDLGSGSHTVQSRATDRDGITQPEERVDPIPDGATGWPATIFTVS